MPLRALSTTVLDNCPPWFMRLAIIHPPDGAIPTVPYSSIPHLNGVLKQHGHTVLACDAGLELVWHVLDQKRLESWWDRADAERARLAKLPQRNEAEAHEHRRLQHLLSVPRAIFAEIGDALAVMKDRVRFRDPAQFSRAFDVVRTCHKFAFTVGPDNYYQGRRVGHAVLAPPTPTPLPDPPLEFFEQMIDELLAQKPDTIGLTVPFDSAVYFGIKIARIIRKKAPHMKILMGGAAIDSQSYRVTSDPFYFQVLDYVMMGEGEVQFPRLLAAMEKGEHPKHTTKNLRWLEPDGTVGSTELELVSDLNAIPAPDFSNMPVQRYLLPDPVATFQTSRGCYYGKCTFCSEMFRKGFRIRKPDLVFEDMVAIYEQTGIRHFQLWDSLAPPKTLKKIAQEVKKRGLPFEWMAETKFEKPYRDEAMIKTLAEGGCTFLQFGLESANPRVLDLIDKGNSVPDIEIILDLMNKHGIRAGTTWFIGFPGETEREADQTHDFVASRRDRVMFSSYTRTMDIGTDTIVHEDRERFGLDVFLASEGVLGWRHKDGTLKWDPDERDQAYHVRGDFYMLLNNIELHYATVPKETTFLLSGQHRVGPVLRMVPAHMLRAVKLVKSKESCYRVYDEHPSGAAGKRYGVAYHSISGFSFDLEEEALAVLRSVDGVERTFDEIVSASGVPEERALRLIEEGVNRGIIKVLLDPKDAVYLPEAVARAEASPVATSA